MSLLLAALLAGALQSQPASGWTWTLYDNTGSVVLAEEIPDSPNLRTTLECQPGSGNVALHIYRNAPPAGDPPGTARLTSGAVEATTEARTGRRGRLETSARVDHSVFAAFVQSGQLTVTTGESSDRISVPSNHLPRLRRFADLCAG